MRKLRKDAVTIFKAALRAANPTEAVLRNLELNGATLRAGRQRYDLKKIRDIYVIGAGKASAAMAVAVERLLGPRITGGLVNVKYNHTARLRRVRLNECGHPVPDEAGVRGAREIAEMVTRTHAEDLVICVISGGASALLPFPAMPITLAEKQETTKLMLQCGANIGEINAVRKHISSIKGGRLAALAYPARVLALLLSDVIGDDLSVIGSGATVPDPSTFRDAWRVLEKYGLTDRVPKAVRERLRAGLAGAIPDTPKPEDPAFARTQNLLVGSNRLALDAAAVEAKRLGYKPLVLSSTIEGETREIARMHAAIAREMVTEGRPVKPPACIITGGETTVTIRGEGLGGRSQEFALAAAIDLAGVDKVAVLCGGTDGTDGPTDAAGGVIDGGTYERARAKGLDPLASLRNNDSYHLLQKTGDLLMTGPTNTNVMDVRLVLAG